VSVGASVILVDEVVGPRGDRHRHLGMAGSLTNSRPFCDDHRRHLVKRYYDPASYQFLSIDPKVSTTMQPYVFVGGDPLNESDPLGQLSLGGFLRSMARWYRSARRSVHQGTEQLEGAWARGMRKLHPGMYQLLKHQSVSIGIGGSAAAGPGGIADIAVGEAGGHAFVSETLGAGGGSPAVSIGPVLSFSNASAPRDLGGKFAYGGASIFSQKGPEIGGGVFAGAGTHNQSIVGGQVSVGAGYGLAYGGAPLEVHGGVSETWVQQP